MKLRQRQCNAIKFKKFNTLLQTKKSLFKVKKFSTISKIRYTRKLKSKHWVRSCLFESNDKKMNKFEKVSIAL